jgi:hypothetical protein
MTIGWSSVCDKIHSATHRAPYRAGLSGDELSIYHPSVPLESLNYTPV